ncbi:RICIN domain-containing protein, partial [Actinoplanes sp. ATCC 53533]|uniref:RICIN domain-containing protein n=1 Tax=Actinoplanes sp. ATCC 53533 TaxID=1288362 RepID=UPI00131520C9
MGEKTSRTAGRRSAVGAAATALIAGSLIVPATQVSAAPRLDFGIRVKAAYTGRCLTYDLRAVPDANDNRPVTQTDCAGATELSQGLAVVPLNDGTYHIGRFNPATRVIDGCVTVKNNLMTANTPIVHHPCTAAGTNDQWRFRSVPGKPTFRIVAESSRLCLSIAPDNTQNNAPLIQKTCGTSATD